MGERPPASAAKTLQGYVLFLRRALASGMNGGASPIVTRAPGYLLGVADDAVDADRFVDLVSRGRLAVGEGDSGAGSILLGEALALWRGEPCAEFLDADFAESEASRLVEMRLDALEARIDAGLDLGEDQELVPELGDLVTRYPLRERFWAQLVIALYRAGRQADALAAYRRARRTLADELGVEPGAELRALEAAVLAQAPELDAPRGQRHGPGQAFGHDRGEASVEGRDADLAWLRGHWAEALAGRGRVVAVVGPRGSGKSLLLAQLAREGHRRRVVVVHEAGARAPNPGSLVGAAGGPVLFLLDEPLTAIAGESVAGLPVLVVVALDSDGAPEHVLTGFADAERRDLAALSGASSRRIVLRLVEAVDADIDVEAVLAGADGLPGRLHELTLAAIDQAASQRIGVAAGTARSARAQLGTARDDLRLAVLGSRRAGVLRATGQSRPMPNPPRCPWLGLAPYERSDAALFRGRDALVATLVGRLAEAPVLAVVGASGTGKSSVVRAGLLVALADGSLPGSNRWSQHVVVPGDPVPARPEGTALVVVDQFEEVWTRLTDAKRHTFLTGLAAVVEVGHRLVLTLRAEYLDRCAEQAWLGPLVAEGTVLVGPMTDAEFRRAVTEPAAFVGLTVESRISSSVSSRTYAHNRRRCQCCLRHWSPPGPGAPAGN